jgi:serine/threonine protein kinase
MLTFRFSGRFPFDGASDDEIFQKLWNEEVDYSSPGFGPPVPDSAIAFLQAVLVKNPQDRLRVEDVLALPFLA